jgi:polyisoprenyl-phosphate glycosyltransferase
MKKLTVVSPAYNEEDSLIEFYHRLTSVLDALEDLDYEVIMVNDGSIDGTSNIIRELHEKNPKWRGIHLSRNFGHQASIAAGLRYATGDLIAIMDSDLQDSPEALPEFVSYWKTGYQVVYAVRAKRKEGLAKRFFYTLFYKILNQIASIKIPLDAGDFSLMDRKVVRELNALSEHNSFIRGLRAWVGFRQIGIPVERNERFAGTPQYSIHKLIKLATDGFFGFSWVPLRFLTVIGIFSLGVSMIYLLSIVYLRLTSSFELPGWTTLIVTVVGFGGAQLAGLGLIGEYIGRIYDEVRKRPHYIVAEIDGMGTQNDGGNRLTKDNQDIM